jgi:hypothetical protein
MKFSTLAAVITALVASSSALPTPAESRKDLVDNVSKLVAGKTGGAIENNFDEVHIRREDLAGSVQDNANENLNNNLDGLIVGPRDDVTLSLTDNGDSNLDQNVDHAAIALPRGLISGLLAGNVNNDVNGNHPKALVRPVVQPKVIPRHELTDLANGNINENKPAVLVRPIVEPKVLLAPALGQREIVHDLLNGNANDNKPKVLVRPIVQPKLNVAPNVVPRALKEVASNDLNDDGNGNEPEVNVRPGVAPKLDVTPVVTPRALRDLLSGDLNGNGNGNKPKVLVRPVVAPKLTAKPVVAPRSEELSDALSNNDGKIVVGDEKLALPELPFAEHEPRALKEILSGDINGDGNGNKPKVLVRPAVTPKLTVKPVVTPRSEELNDIDEKIAFPELFAEHEIRALKEILSGDVNGDANGNKPKALVRPAVTPKVNVKPVVTPRGEGRSHIEEEFDAPESFFAPQGSHSPVDIKHGTLSGDANGNLNDNEPKALVRPIVGPHAVVGPVVHI